MDATQAAALRAEFPPETIGKLPKPFSANAEKGKCRECNGYHGLPAVHLDYVGHAAVTDRLLQVDPMWSWEPLAVDERGIPALDNKGNLWIRLTIAGVTRIGVGDGKSAKECIGDAIRNASMRFGVALDFWAKEDLHAIRKQRGEDHVEKSPPSNPEPELERTTEPTRSMRRASAQSDTDVLSDAQLKKVNILLREKGYTQRDIALAHLTDLLGRDVDTSKTLTKAEASKVIEAMQAPTQPAEPTFDDAAWQAGESS